LTKNVKAPNGRTITLVRNKVNAPWSFKNSKNLNNYSINKRLTNNPEIFQNVNLARTAPAHKWEELQLARSTLENVKPTPAIKEKINILNQKESQFVADQPEPGKNIKVKALANQVWNRAWGGYGGAAVNVNYPKIAKQIKSQVYYNKLVNGVTHVNLNNEINKIVKRQPWYSGRGAADVYRSKQIIRALFGLQLNAPPQVQRQAQRQMPRQAQRQKPRETPANAKSYKQHLEEYGEY
jgi:hypothetical protein